MTMQFRSWPPPLFRKAFDIVGKERSRSTAESQDYRIAVSGELAQSYPRDVNSASCPLRPRGLLVRSVDAVKGHSWEGGGLHCLPALAIAPAQEGERVVVGRAIGWLRPPILPPSACVALEALSSSAFT